MKTFTIPASTIAAYLEQMEMDSKYETIDDAYWTEQLDHMIRNALAEEGHRFYNIGEASIIVDHNSWAELPKATSSIEVTIDSKRRVTTREIFA